MIDSLCNEEESLFEFLKFIITNQLL
jgi:hypothetical protein